MATATKQIAIPAKKAAQTRISARRRGQLAIAGKASGKGKRAIRNVERQNGYGKCGAIHAEPAQGEEPAMSAISYMELLQGMRNAQELRLLKKYLKKLSVNIVQVNENISVRAINLVESYHLSNSMNLQDALIAATAIELGETMATGNYRHFSYLPNIEVKKFSPQ